MCWVRCLAAATTLAAACGDNYVVPTAGDAGTQDGDAGVQNVGLARVTLVTAGDRESCAVSYDRSLWCWGRASFAAPALLPLQVDGSYTAVAAGSYNNCAIRDDGSLWCSGDDFTQAWSDLGGNAWSTVSVAGDFACGLQSDGSPWCWGFDSIAPYGTMPTQIAVGSWTTIAVDAGQDTGGPIVGATVWATRADGTLWRWTDANGPSQIAGTTWQSVAAGSGYACAVQTDSTLWCWGRNDSGQLGVGAGPDVATPTQVPGSWTSVSARTTHTCGRQSDGSLWCWGANASGQLGDQSSTASAVPVRVAGAGRWDSVSVGTEHTCAVRDSGSLWCWGSNGAGEIGTGVQTGDVSVYPQQVAGTKWDQIAMGRSYGCATQLDGSLWCWGANDGGQLGLGTTGDLALPARVAGSGYASVSANTSTCATRGDGTLWCWGPNPVFPSPQLTPALVPSPTSGVTWTAVSVGYSHTCALTSDQGLWCWGDNTDGELGATSPASSATPLRVTGTWSAVSAGSYGTCALATDGGLWCWGNNYENQVDGMRLVDQGPWIDVALGTNVGCALKSDHSVWCWGSNDLLMMNFAAFSPTGQTGVTDLFVGSGDDVCTSAGDGTLHCWGQFTTGDGYQNGSPQPKLVLGIGWEVAAVGGGQTCARKSDHTLWCWGSNFHGALGYGGAFYDTPTQVTGALGPAPGGGSTVDLSPPTITSVTPTGTGVVETSSIVVQFSIPVDPAVFTTNVMSVVENDDGLAVAGQLVLAPDLESVTFRPASPFGSGLQFDVTISTALRSVVGTQLAAPYAWSFTTREDPSNGPPTVQWTAPAAGSTNQPAAAQAMVKFTSALDCTSVASNALTVTEGGTQVSGSTTCNGSVVRFVPTVALPTNTQLNAALAGTVCSYGGNCQGVSASWSFLMSRWLISKPLNEAWATIAPTANGGVLVAADDWTGFNSPPSIARYAANTTVQWTTPSGFLGGVISSGSSDGAYLFGAQQANGSTCADPTIAAITATGGVSWSTTIAASIGAASCAQSPITGAGTDSAGNVYATGSTLAALPGNVNAGNGDCFIARFTSTGTQQWLLELGTSVTDECWGISVDSTGNSYTGGITCGAFDGHASLGGCDFIVVKLDASGTKQWSAQFGTNGEDRMSGIALASDGSIYVVGSQLVKLDSGGNVLWMHAPANGDTLTSVAAVSGGIVIGGANAGQGFVALLDTNGVEQWRYTRSDPATNTVQSIGISGSSVLLGGYNNSVMGFVEKVDLDGTVR